MSDETIALHKKIIREFYLLDRHQVEKFAEYKRSGSGEYDAYWSRLVEEVIAE